MQGKEGMDGRFELALAFETFKNHVCTLAEKLKEMGRHYRLQAGKELNAVELTYCERKCRFRSEKRPQFLYSDFKAQNSNL